MSGSNLVSPSATNSAVLIADSVATSGGSSDSIATFTKVGGLPVAAALEVQSTHGAILFPRMTTTEITALASSATAVTDGMVVYDTTAGALKVRQGGAWLTITAA